MSVRVLKIQVIPWYVCGVYVCSKCCQLGALVMCFSLWRNWHLSRSICVQHTATVSGVERLTTVC